MVEYVTLEPPQKRSKKVSKVATTFEASDHKPTKKRKIKNVQAPAVTAEEEEDEEEEMPLRGRA